jgi:Lipocalin-like domain
MPSLQDRLPGTYRLVSLVTTTTTGEVSRPMGDQPTGLFVFDRAGNYSVQLTSTGAGDRPAMAMFGNYRVDDDAATFVLTPEAATDPSLVGTDVGRHVTLRDDVGVFETPPFTVDGVEATTVITWRRVTDPA